VGSGETRWFGTQPETQILRGLGYLGLCGRIGQQPIELDDQVPGELLCRGLQHRVVTFATFPKMVLRFHSSETHGPGSALDC
jgi:hypothetical protein